MKTKPALGLGFINGAQTVQLTTNIITALTGNANFTTPSPTLVELGAARDLASDKIDAYEAAADAAAIALSNRDMALEDLRVKLTAEASYVDGIAKGSENIITSAGMPVRSTPAPVAITQVHNLKLTASDEEGEVFATWDRVLGARFYKVQICTDATTPPTNWVFKLDTTKSKCTLNDTLVSGQKVWVRVKACGPHNEGPWSDPAIKTVP